MRELILSSGPDRYFGGTIETFALPYGAFIVIALVLYYIFRHPHSVPKMKYLTPAHQTSLGTREPGTTGVITLRPPIPASATAVEADIAVPGGQQPHASETLHQPVADRTEPAPEASNPEASNPEASDPVASNPEASGPEASTTEGDA